MMAKHRYIFRRRRLGQHTEPTVGINILVSLEDAGRDRMARRTMKTIGPDDEIAAYFLIHALVSVLHRRGIVLNAFDCRGGRLVEYLVIFRCKRAQQVLGKL